MATIRHSATLGIGAQLSRSWSSSVGAVVSGTGKIKNEVDRLKAASHEASSRLKDMLASGRYYDQSAESVRRLRGEHERLTSALAHQQRRLQTLKAWHDLDAGGRASAALGRIGSGLASVGTAAGVAAAAVGGAGVAALTWFTKSAIESTAKLETLKTSLETLEGSPEKAQQSLDWVTKFAAETPFKLEEVGEAYARLRGYGIDPTAGSLLTLGDAAGGMSKKVMDGVEALSDAMTNSNERLKEFGNITASVKGTKTTYSYLDKAGKDVTKTVDNRNKQMIASTLLAIWNDKYAGGMKKQSRTWAGLVAGIQDQWMLFQVKVMQSGPFDRMKAKLEGLQASINRWASDGTLDKWATRIGSAYEFAFDKLEQGFSWLDANWDSKVIPGMKSAWEETKKVVDVVVTLSSWLTNAVGGAGNLATGVAALGAASTLAPVFSLVKVGLDVVGWLSKATGLTGLLAAGFARVASAAGLAQGAAAAAGAAGSGAAAGGAAVGASAIAATAGMVAVGGGVAAYGGWKLAEHVVEQREAKGIVTESHEQNARESGERVRLMRLGRAALGEAASEGVERGSQAERMRLLRAGKAADVEASRALAEREGLNVTPASAPAELRPPAMKPPVIELPKPQQPAKREALEAPAVRGARESAPKPTVIELPKPERAAPARVPAPSVQQVRPAVAPADVRTITLPQPTASVTHIHKYDNRRIDMQIDAKGADANEVARLVERKLQSESLASYEGVG